MKAQTPYYLKTLRDEFSARTERKGNYSLRAFARYLGIGAPALLGVLKGSRGIPKAKAEPIARKLGLSPREQEAFIKSNNERSQKSATVDGAVHQIERFQLDPEVHFRIVAEWEHYAILSLVETSEFKADSKWIAKRLGISIVCAQTALENLVNANLLKIDETGISATHHQLTTTDDIPSLALRKARQQDLDLAMNSIDEVSVALRDLSACTMTMDTNDIQEFKQMIRDFRRRFMKQAESKKGNEVYKLAIQLFPLTKVGRKNETI